MITVMVVVGEKLEWVESQRMNPFAVAELKMAYGKESSRGKLSEMVEFETRAAEVAMG
jgi:hypothetical protein